MTTRIILALALLPTAATAGPPVNFGFSDSGTLYFNECGVFNDPVAGAGFEIAPEFPQDPPPPYQEISYGGSASNRVVVQWTEGGVPMQAVADSVTGECDWDVQSFTAGAFRGASSGLVMRKGEGYATGLNMLDTWYVIAYAVGFEFMNVGTEEITDLRVLHSFDPELDEAINGDEATLNDVYDTNGWGFPNWAVAMAEESNITVGYYACAEGDSVGFLPTGADPDSELLDPQGQSGDLELVWRSRFLSIDPGESRLVKMSLLGGGGVDQSRDWGAIAADGSTIADDYSRLAANNRVSSCNWLDDDGDGVMGPRVGGLDCNDGNAAIGGATLQWPDLDRDGFGNAEDAFARCQLSFSAVVAGGTPDCDDDNVDRAPGAEEVCNGVDDNCDGVVDDGLPETLFYADTDMDGFGDPLVSQGTCQDSLQGFIRDAGDCDDTNASINPDATEVAGNSIDEDCNGEWECFVDDDGDGFAADGADIAISDDADCDDLGEAAVHGDCDDTDATVSPGGTDTPGSGIDADCDGFITCWQDADGDGFGDPDAQLVLTDATGCEEGVDTASDAGDCDDTNADINPDANEIDDNEVDEDCDGVSAMSEEPATDVDSDSDSGTTSHVEGGCGCEAGGQNAGWLALGLLPLVLRRRRRLDASLAPDRSSESAAVNIATWACSPRSHPRWNRSP